MKYASLASKVLFLFLFIVLFITAGFRYESGTDYNSYVVIYNYLGGEGHYWAFLEPGIILLVKLSQFITNNPRIFFVFSSLITLLFIFIGIYSYTSQRILSVIVFVLAYHFFNSFNLVGQYIAVSIYFCFCVRYLVIRSFKRYLVATVLAACFHVSAILMVPMYYILVKKYSVRGYLILLSFGGLLLLIYPLVRNHIFTLFPYYEHYFDYKSSSANLFVATGLIVLLPVIFNVSDFIGKSRLNLVLFNCFLFSILVSLFSYQNIIFFRLSMYLGISVVILVPCVLEYISNVNDKAVYVMTVLFCLSIAFSMYASANVAGIFPYAISIAS